ncbi:hypothetical protein J3Q64DRAFT_1745678 [Phycomyces blakesleeanus]
MSAIAWPVSGIHEAVGSIIKAWRADKIIGIGNFKLERYVVENPLERYYSDANLLPRDENGFILGTGLKQIRFSMSILRTNLERAQLKNELEDISTFDNAFKIMDENLAEIEQWRRTYKATPKYQLICGGNANVSRFSKGSDISKESSSSEKPFARYAGDISTHGSSTNFKKFIVDNDEKSSGHLNITKPDDGDGQFREYLRKKSSQMYNRIAHDNGAYLDQILTEMGPKNAKKMKHAILNGSIYIGYNQEEAAQRDLIRQLTINMEVTGPGARCKYQMPVHPVIIRYLPTDMLDQLKIAGNLEDTSSLSKITSAVQLLYTVYEIVRGSGNGWSKLIMGVFMIMSLLQTASLVFLPTQLVAFSIHCKTERNMGTNSYNLAEKITHPITRLLTRILPKFLQNLTNDIVKEHDYALIGALEKSALPPMLIYKIMMGLSVSQVSSSIQPAGRWETLVIIGGTVVPLLLGLLAGYTEPSPAKWIVLAWIVGSWPFTFIRIYVIDPNYMVNKLAFALTTLFLVLPGIALVISATVIGNLPK